MYRNIVVSSSRATTTELKTSGDKANERISNDAKSSIPFDSSKNIYNVLSNVYDPITLKTLESLYFIRHNKENGLLTSLFIDSSLNSKLELDFKYLVDCFKIFAEGDDLVVSHNHPNGISIPSLHDYNFTEIVAKICKKIRVNFVDHIVYCENEYYSFKDSGLISKIKNRID